jgi:hypothetical protein
MMLSALEHDTLTCLHLSPMPEGAALDSPPDISVNASLAPWGVGCRAVSLHAFLDEAGDRSHGAKATDHFVMAAVVLDASDLTAASQMLSRLRTDLGRRPTDPLHWRNLKSHSQRLHAAQIVGDFEKLTVSSVVVCKRLLSEAPIRDQDAAYLYTLRYLVERLSWLARDSGTSLTYTLAHIVRFKLGKLRQYEAALGREPHCKIAWTHIGGPGSLNQPARVEHLQIADVAASAMYQAFEPDPYGNTERRYLEAIVPRLYRHPPGPLTSYGLKMHPWNEKAKSAYRWVADLT